MYGVRLVVQSGGVQKSVSDDREFRYFQLENQLKVIVVSDPSTEKVRGSAGRRVVVADWRM